MKKLKLDKYDIILEEMECILKNSDVVEEIEVDNDSLTELMNELGIKTSKNTSHSLILWNDEVNDMLHVVLALYEICKLNNQEAMRIMMEAHLKGKAVAKSGSFEDMNKMKQGLNDRKIEATVEN